jgi:hypothetical protein
MHPHEEHGEKFWEEVRLLETIVEDVSDETDMEQVKKINWFLNEQCDELSVGHEKCKNLLEGNPVLPAYETIDDYEQDEPHVVGCYGCGEMYQTESNGMPDQFDELREVGFIRVGEYRFGRTVS